MVVKQFQLASFVFADVEWVSVVERFGCGQSSLDNPSSDLISLDELEGKWAVILVVKSGKFSEHA